MMTDAWEPSGVPQTSNIPIAPAADVELCPWNDRRLPREMMVKLVVIHISVFASYSHLLHLRREKRNLLHFLFLVGYPVFGVGLVIWPLLGLALQVILSPRDKEKLLGTIGVLIGRLSSADDDEEQQSQLRPVAWPPKFTWNWLRALAAQCVTLSQCITSIWLFARRAHHDSAALYDFRVLQLALLGLGSSSMAITHLVLQPQCLHRYILRSGTRIAPVTDLVGPHGPDTFEWTAWYRPIAVSPYTDDVGLNSIDLQCRAWRWLFDMISVTLILSAFSMFGVPFMSDVFTKEEIFGGMFFWWSLIPTFFRKSYYYVIIAAILAVSYRKPILRLPSQDRLSILALVVLLPLVVPAFFAAMFLVTTLSISIFYVASLLLSPIFQLWHLLGKPDGWKYYARSTYQSDGSGIWPFLKPDWDSIWTYGHVSPTIPCPMAWKDPAADYVWAIA